MRTHRSQHGLVLRRQAQPGSYPRSSWCGRHERDGNRAEGTSHEPAELLLWPTIRHPDLDGVVPEGIAEGSRPAIHVKLARDADGRPVDALHVHGDAAREDSVVVEKAIWSRFGAGAEPPACLGRTAEGQRTEPLAITQLLLVYHLLDASR